MTMTLSNKGNGNTANNRYKRRIMRKWYIFGVVIKEIIAVQVV